MNSDENYKKFKDRVAQINSNPPTFLALSGHYNGVQTYVCPCCQSGSGSHRSGIAKVPNSKSYHCFACGETEDTIGLAMKFYNCDLKEAVKKLEEHYRLNPVEYTKSEEEPSEPMRAYTNQMEFFKEARQNLDPTYLESRGISAKTQKHFWVGTVLNWINPITLEDPKKKQIPSPRCIIPTSSFSYLARDIRTNLSEAQKKYSKIKYGKTRLYNEALTNAKIDLVYIVEGEIDAMSIYEVSNGYIQAIGLGSTSMWRDVYNCIEEHNYQNKTFVLMLDNDEPGKKCLKNIETMFKIHNISYMVQEYPLEFNDPNEFLVKNRSGFINMVKETYKKYREMIKEQVLEME